MACNFPRLFVRWYIVCTNISRKVMRVFPQKRFHLVLHTFNPHTKKILHMHLTVFRWMWDIISSNIFDNADTKYYQFLCLLWSVIFRRGSVGSIVTEFLRRMLFFVLFMNWCTRAITTFVSFINFISRCFCLQYFYHLRCYQLSFFQFWTLQCFFRLIL